MPAIPPHSTAVVDEPWDGPAEEAKLDSPVTGAVGKAMYAWYDGAADDPDGDGYPDAKSAWKFPHHQVAGGRPGAANLAGVRNALSRLPQADIPDGDRDGVKAHLERHLDDEEKGESPEEEKREQEPSGALVGVGGAGERYPRIMRAVAETPWAILPSTFHAICELLAVRAAGGMFTDEEVAARIGAGPASRKPAARGTVAVLPLYGTIIPRANLMTEISGGQSLRDFSNALAQATADAGVESILIDVDSPGGSVDLVPEVAAQIRDATGQKPVVAQVNTMAASAAYWLASQASEVVITPSGSVGSIGVFAAHDDISGMQDKMGVKTTLVSAGKYKVEGNPFGPLGDDARAAIQAAVDDFYGMFVRDVAKGRGIAADVVRGDAFGQGRMVRARDAVASGMADRIDTFQGTAQRMLRGALPGGPMRAAAPGPQLEATRESEDDGLLAEIHKRLVQTTTSLKEAHS